ncbi:MAG TPA: hypothetical protein VF881_05160 [Polyangiaceae bacterium]
MSGVRSETPSFRSFWSGLGAVAFAGGAIVGFACGGSSRPASDQAAADPRQRTGDGGVDDQSRCEFRGRADRESVETAGPGAVQPNVRRVYQMVGTGESMHKVIACREIDTNLDGVKDIVRTYNEKGESVREQADTNYDGRIDTWIEFAAGRMSKEELDTDFNGQPDVWKYYVGGLLSRIQRDTNHDGRPDRWEFYTSGKLERVGVDLDFDGHVDRWDHDELARLAAEAQDRGSSQGAKSAESSSPSDGGLVPPASGDLSKLGADGGAEAGATKRKKK